MGKIITQEELNTLLDYKVDLNKGAGYCPTKKEIESYWTEFIYKAKADTSGCHAYLLMYFPSGKAYALIPLGGEIQAEYTSFSLTTLFNSLASTKDWAIYLALSSSMWNTESQMSITFNIKIGENSYSVGEYYNIDTDSYIVINKEFNRYNIGNITIDAVFSQSNINKVSDKKGYRLNINKNENLPFNFKCNLDGTGMVTDLTKIHGADWVNINNTNKTLSSSSFELNRQALLGVISKDKTVFSPLVLNQTDLIYKFQFGTLDGSVLIDKSTNVTSVSSNISYYPFISNKSSGGSPFDLTYSVNSLPSWISGGAYSSSGTSLNVSSNDTGITRSFKVIWTQSESGKQISDTITQPTSSPDFTKINLYVERWNDFSGEFYIYSGTYSNPTNNVIESGILNMYSGLQSEFTVSSVDANNFIVLGFTADRSDLVMYANVAGTSYQLTSMTGGTTTIVTDKKIELMGDEIYILISDRGV